MNLAIQISFRQKNWKHQNLNCDRVHLLTFFWWKVKKRWSHSVLILFLTSQKKCCKKFWLDDALIYNNEYFMLFFFWIFFKISLQYWHFRNKTFGCCKTSRSLERKNNLKNWHTKLARNRQLGRYLYSIKKHLTKLSFVLHKLRNGHYTH